MRQHTGQAMSVADKDFALPHLGVQRGWRRSRISLDSGTSCTFWLWAAPDRCWRPMAKGRVRDRLPQQRRPARLDVAQEPHRHWLVWRILFSDHAGTYAGYAWGSKAKARRHARRQLVLMHHAADRDQHNEHDQD